MIYVLCGLLFILIFGVVQGTVYLISGTTPTREAKKHLERIKNSKVVKKESHTVANTEGTY